ncbi:MAG: ParB/RepB/Spo0J family partition protein [Firmicutes bacterium]|nr:ParB/RepB/Spo0J family partition protein [Dethiobacter sp.]MBS3888827.1 ParB/RepB/Spo0J family partition protein [Bacillota bacterium]
MMRWFGGRNVEQVLQLNVNDVKPNPYQPRKTFSEDCLAELRDSIKQVGIIQPLVVRKVGNIYELVAGERRLRAAKAAGFSTVPAVVRQYTDQEVAQATLIENIQREELNVLEEAVAYDQLLTQFQITQEELAKRVGKSQSTIANKRRLLKLSTEVKELLASGAVNERQARALLKIEDGDVQTDVAAKIISEDMTVRQVEEAVERYLAGEPVTQAIAATAVKPVRKLLVRDVRIFVNTVRQAVDLMKRNGVAASVQERDSDEYYEVVVRIPKSK